MALRALTQHGRAPLLLLLLPWLQLAVATPGPCEVETGQSSIIVDIEESLGLQINQSTVPAQLPIVGTPGEDVLLSTVFPKGPTLFQLDGKRLQLLQPLDRDADNLSHMVFQLVCQVITTKRRKTIPVIVRVSDINDNAPVFQGTPYETSISELTPVGTTIFDKIKAVDTDAGVNGLAEYFIVPGDNGTLEQSYAEDGYGFFSIALPHQGQVTVNKALDYERTQKYLVTIVASDRARDTKRRLSSTTTLVVNVQDDDDQDPSFIYKGCSLHDGACINPEYTSYVNSGVLAGLLNIEPEKVQAVDMDTLNAKIKYSIESGEPESWHNYFAIDENSGAVRQLEAVDTGVAKKFQLVIRAEEVTESRRFTTAKLTIAVRPVDSSPPVVMVTSDQGMVEENSPKGTKVVDDRNEPLRFDVMDPDLGPDDPVPKYTFELTTNYFDIDVEGYLLVNSEKLDRDPPNPDTYRFQVVAREWSSSEGGGAASAPFSVSVKLLDQNDNAPVIPKTQPVTVPANLDPTVVHKVEATDIDEGDNARITYGIFHVSNNGASKFTIDPKTGVISSTGRLVAGEQYSITIVATDSGGLSSQGIVEVSVSRGANTRAPAFSSREYSARVSEGAALNSTVTTVTAKDPENEAVTYSIVSGNDLRQFAIGSSTGIITVIRRLDREVLTRYQLVVKAEDTGNLASTATVNIKVTDINDNNPEFKQDLYNFSVLEGAANEFVGQVFATDADEGINSVISYSLPNNIPFSIDNVTGTITTNTALDYEQTKEYAFVVTALDGAPDRRLGTASVLVAVKDASDEPPTFRNYRDTATVPENMPGYHVATVEAFDPDTVPEITYAILRGDLELFSIDRKTGLVRTVKSLDREKAAKHELVIGTEENPGTEPGAVMVLQVFVEDKNDNAPIFTSVIRPITIEDTASIGTLVQTVTATDDDATSPNNQVRYKLVGRGKTGKYFHVEPDTGDLRVKNDLRKESDSEYTIDVQAYDQGSPMMSSVSSLTVYVSHSTTVAPDVGLGFADSAYTVHVAENSPNGTLVRVLPLLNKRAHSPDIPLYCRLTRTTQEGTFIAKINDDRDCAIYLNTTNLDFESTNEFTLEVQLESIQGLINPENSKASIKIHVIDVNDNAPVFVIPDQSTIAAAKGKYYAIVTTDMLLGTNVLQVNAKDKDSGDFGKIEYQKNSWNKVTEEYFNLDPETGVISNAKTFENVPEKVLPFKFSVTARDNPNSSDYNVARAAVVINLLQKSNQLVLEVANLNSDVMRRQARSLLSTIEEKTGLITGVEKFTLRHYLGENGTLEKDEKGTDVWLYLIDPVSGEILNRESSSVKKAVESSNFRSAISSRLQAPVSPPRAPLAPSSTPPARTRVPPAPLAAALPAALLALAALVLVAAASATVYICASWSRYKRHKQHAAQQYGGGGAMSVSSAPRRPASAGAAPDSTDTDDDTATQHRYETQVLNMAVEDGDLQLDFSSNNHAFNIHNVHYLSKENGERSPTLSETATTARASSVNENGTLNNHIYDTMPNNIATVRNTQTLNRRAHPPHHPLNNALGTLPRANNHAPTNGLLAATLGRRQHQPNNKKKLTQPIMAYDEIPGMQRSTDNDNVTFGKRNFNGYGYDQSPIETTTEL